MTSSNSREMKQKLSGFKTEVANSMNISLNQGYNGDISAAMQAGSAARWLSA